uniref:DNA fragmentation factor, beta polypeptide (caspase-activated DNase) n=1 Tax=Sinocyclocheilus grahami TaxID=75366 RepID=A0A672NH06_SINGR
EAKSRRDFLGCSLISVSAVHNSLSFLLLTHVACIDARFKTKSAYIKYNCESRIRGYLKEVDGYTQTIPNAKTKSEYKKVVEIPAEKLKAARYNGTYVDRSERDIHRLCTQEGWFTCQVSFLMKPCAFLHSINPYWSLESGPPVSKLVFFRIEKKRTVIPTFAEALKGNKSGDINMDYFYKLLFTRENLKLVHIVCHKKGAHELSCDSRKIYKRVRRVTAVCVHFGWVKCRALIPNMDHHTWSHVTSL